MTQLYYVIKFLSLLYHCYVKLNYTNITYALKSNHSKEIFVTLPQHNLNVLNSSISYKTQIFFISCSQRAYSVEAQKKGVLGSSDD